MYVSLLAHRNRYLETAGVSQETPESPSKIGPMNEPVINARPKHAAVVGGFQNAPLLGVLGEPCSDSSKHLVDAIDEVVDNPVIGNKWR